MRTPIRLAGRSRLVARLLAGALAAILAGSPALAPVVAASPRTATAASTTATHRAAPAAQVPTARAAVSRTAPASLLSSSACTLAATTWSCDLWARTGTLTLADATSVPIWGYAATSSDPAGVPGPTLIVTAGHDLSITLHNVNLPSATSLAITELPGIPDQTGVTAGNNRTYTLASAGLAAGTYLYEAGLTPDGPRQVAMGLSGALIVRPASCGVAPSCAYGASTAFTDEGLLFLSEVDPAFNAAPATYNLSEFAPKYWLINGRSFPQTDAIPTDAGHDLLLRYVNGGLVHHPMSLLGLHESIVANDGKVLANRQLAVDDTVAAGATVDAIVTIPATAPAGTRYALFDAAMRLDNDGILATPPAASPENTPIAFGGMLTFIQVAGAATGGGAPVTSAVTISPTPTNGSTPDTLSATVTSAGSTVTAAEYFVDSIGPDGAGCALTGAFGSASVAVSATIPTSGATAPCADLATLAAGTHTFYVHGQDATSAWGAVASAHLMLDKAGPATSGLSLNPSRSNGTAAVALGATASDAATGGADVTAAEFFLDPVGTPAPGTGTAISISIPTTTVSLAATIPALTVGVLSDGAHTVAVRAEDALGNWGAFGTVTLTVDKTGPAASGVSATPNPANGLFGVQIGSAGQLYERIDATITDPVSGGVNSNVTGAEYFFDTVGANGTGGAMLAGDGTFNSSTEAVVGAAELFAIAALSQGSHTIYVHGRDAAGNWGPMSTTILVVDRTRPYITSASVSPNPTGGAAAVTLAVSVIDTSLINRIEYYVDVDPGLGLGTSLTATPALPTKQATASAVISISAAGLTIGSHTVFVRARNALGNWSATTSLPLAVTALFADGFESGSFSAWSSTSGPTQIAVTAAAAQAGTYGMAATIGGGTSGYAQDNTPNAETTYNAAFQLNPNAVTLANLTGYTVFTALNNTNAQRFAIQLRRTGTQYQVAAVLNRNGGTTTSTWVNVATSAFTKIEAIWTRVGNNLTLRLYTGGVLGATVTGPTGGGFAPATYRIDTVRLGPQGTLTGATGSIYIDAFVSTRNTVVGP